MKRITLALLATAAMVSCTVPLKAADAPKSGPMVIAQAQLFNWSGFYLGGHGGWTTVALDSSVGDTDFSGWFGGGQIGYDYQFSNRIVLGVLADVSISNAERTVSGAGVEADLGGTVRARLGYGADGFMPYLTGGAAWQRGSIASATNTHWGWVAGAGLEARLWPNWTSGGEYLYLGLGDERYFGVPVEPSSHQVRAFLNYRFVTR